MKKILVTLVVFFNCFLFANDFPNKPITFVVGLGEGGSADRIARRMAVFLQEELKTPINVINIKQNASLDAANFVLNQPSDGYTVFASTFSPYLINTILSGKAKYKLEDFEFINLQWFDYDFFAVNKTSKLNSIKELLESIKNNPKKLSAAVINKSSGHLILKLLLEKSNIPQENLNLKFFNGGKSARKALFDKDVDLLVIAAQGSEKYREQVKPLAVVSSKRSKRWDAPTLNEALKDSKIELPVLNGPIRGFAVTKKFRKNHPNRYYILKKSLEKVLAKRKVQKALKKEKIGYIWVGSEVSNQSLKENHEIIKTYNYLLDDL